MTLVRSPPAGAIRLLWFLRFAPLAPPGEIASLKQTIISCPEVLHSVEIEGSFDFIVEAEIADFGAYRVFLDRFADRLPGLVTAHDVGFICRRYIRDDGDDRRALWVPMDHGYRRIEERCIDHVSAEGDYVRVHVGATSYLVNSTMNAMEERLRPPQFLRLHRSTIVRDSFLARVVHQGQHWSAVLADGSERRIARSHVADVLSVVRANGVGTAEGPPMVNGLQQAPPERAADQPGEAPDQGDDEQPRRAAFGGEAV